MAVMVPSTVEITVARMAMVRDTYTALLISTFCSSSPYHRSEKPVKRVSDLDELNEKIIVTRIGR